MSTRTPTLKDTDPSRPKPPGKAIGARPNSKKDVNGWSHNGSSLEKDWNRNGPCTVEVTVTLKSEAIAAAYIFLTAAGQIMNLGAISPGESKRIDKASAFFSATKYVAMKFTVVLQDGFIQQRFLYSEISDVLTEHRAKK